VIKLKKHSEISKSEITQMENTAQEINMSSATSGSRTSETGGPNFCRNLL